MNSDPQDQPDGEPTPSVPSGGVPPEVPPTPPASRGTIRTQEPGSTQPRKPTVAEARARDKARKAREEAERFAAEQAAKEADKARKRRTALMGSAAVVGVVAVVALGYHVLKDDDEVEATCVRDGSNEVVPDSYCASGTPSGGGVGGLFIFAGSPYRYYYGGTNRGVGTIASGGTLELPKGTSARTKSGTSIKRGGFGTSSGYGSSGS